MRTSRFFIGIALLSLGTFSFGQNNSLFEKVFHRRSNQVEYIAANHVTSPGKIEMKVQEFLSINNRFAINDEPVVYLSYTVARADVVYEEIIMTEAWMTSPFEADLAEAGIGIEDWMLAPFDHGLNEDNIPVERWMTTPFESNICEEEMELESWMTSAWT